jgi:hypothetical protein
MDLASLAFRTDLAMLEHSGSTVEDRGTHLVVRTPDNPTFWWGNFLLLPAPPADVDDAQHWLSTFEEAFPEARHRTFGIDGVDGGSEDLAPFSAIGLDLDVSTVMTATVVPGATQSSRRRSLSNAASSGTAVTRSTTCRCGSMSCSGANACMISWLQTK